MPRPQKEISIGLLAAARDGDLCPAEAARVAGVSYQVFDCRLRKFRVQQAKQRSTKAMQNCADWLAFCLRIGFKPSEVDDLELLWWRWHDENGNILLSARR